MDKKKIGKVLYRLFDGLLNLILLAFGGVVLWLLSRRTPWSLC